MVTSVTQENAEWLASTLGARRGRAGKKGKTHSVRCKRINEQIEYMMWHLEDNELQVLYEYAQAELVGRYPLDSYIAYRTEPEEQNPGAQHNNGERRKITPYPPLNKKNEEET